MLDKFSLQIEKAMSVCNEVYIMGDISIDMKNGILMNTTWKEIVETNDLAQVINKYTRVTAHSQKIIDHVYASISENIAETFVQGQLLEVVECHIYLYCFTFDDINLNRALVIIVLFPTKYSNKKVCANDIRK